MGRAGVRVGLVALMVLCVVAVVGWRLVDGVHHPRVDGASGRSDAVVVFAGEERRFIEGRRLVEAGQASVLVLSAGRLPSVAEGWCAGDAEAIRFEVVCVTPDPSSTRGEAAAFAAVARDHGWTRLVGVTGDYHAARASMLLGRCFPGELSWSPVEWPTPSWRLTLTEVAKTVGDWLWSHRC